jgi:hypothetical protein
MKSGLNMPLIYVHGLNVLSGLKVSLPPSPLSLFLTHTHTHMREHTMSNFKVVCQTAYICYLY